MVGLFRMGIGGSLLMIVSLLSGKSGVFLTFDPSKLSVIFIGGTILFLYVYTWYKALKFAPVSLATLILTFAIVVGNILNGAFAGVKILPNDLYSSILISGAIFLILSHSSLYRIYSRLWMRFKNHRLPE